MIMSLRVSLRDKIDNSGLLYHKEHVKGDVKPETIELRQRDYAINANNNTNDGSSVHGGKL